MTKEELISLYGPFCIVNTAEGFFIINEKLKERLYNWLITPACERHDPVEELYFTNARLLDGLESLRFKDVWVEN